MNNQRQEMDMGFTQEVIPECHHLCLIYDSEEERRKIVSEYLAAGLKRGEIVRYFADTTAPDDIYAWLSELGLEPREDDSFRIIKAESAYCPSGSLIPQEVIDNAVARYAMAKEAGFSGSRACGEMTWVLRGIPGSERLLEYEVGLFDGVTLFKVLQVHPFMVAQGQIVRNPFYMKPEEFLKQLKPGQ